MYALIGWGFPQEFQSSSLHSCWWPKRKVHKHWNGNNIRFRNQTQTSDSNVRVNLSEKLAKKGFSWGSRFLRHFLDHKNNSSTLRQIVYNKMVRIGFI